MTIYWRQKVYWQGSISGWRYTEVHIPYLSNFSAASNFRDGIPFTSVFSFIVLLFLLKNKNHVSTTSILNTVAVCYVMNSAYLFAIILWLQSQSKLDWLFSRNNLEQKEREVIIEKSNLNLPYVRTIHNINEYFLQPTGTNLCNIGYMYVTLAVLIMIRDFLRNIEVVYLK